MSVFKFDKHMAKFCGQFFSTKIIINPRITIIFYKSVDPPQMFLELLKGTSTPTKESL